MPEIYTVIVIFIVGSSQICSEISPSAQNQKYVCVTSATFYITHLETQKPKDLFRELIF
jgi:hypothetical protein